MKVSCLHLGTWSDLKRIHYLDTYAYEKFAYDFSFLINIHELIFNYICFSIAEAIKNIINYMGLQPCERSDKVPEGKSSHTLYLAGVYRGGHDILVRAKLALSDGVTMQITVRSTDAYASEVVASAVG